MNKAQWKMPTKIGNLYLVASDVGLQGVYLKRRFPKVKMVETLNGQQPAIKILKKSVEALDKYFAGQLMDFDLPLDINGTPFQTNVWKQLSLIPYGKTCSYKDIAKKIKNEKAVRAVGTANGKNPLCIVIPCHRVIAADGTLGGYSGGLDIKAKLLELEAAFLN